MSSRASATVWPLIVLCLVGCLMATEAAFSQAPRTGSIRGLVVPSHDHPLTLATARLPDLGLRVTIAADGSFRFDGLRPGAYLLEVRVPTVGTAVERVVVEAGRETEIEVDISPGSHFEEVVVTAPGDARDALELANAVTSLSGEELKLRQEATLGETLSQEPGITSSFFGAGASRPIIRGFTGDRVRMLEGGIGTGDASGVSADHAVTADPGQAERIEVLRGPATLLYGSSAIGGAVNVIDERIPTTRAAAPFSGTADLRLGSVSDERVGGVNLNGGKGDWAWHVDALGRETDPYEIPGFARRQGSDDDSNDENPFGAVPNTDLETRSGRLGLTRFFDDQGFLGLSWSGFESEYGVPAAHGHGEEEDEGELGPGEEETVRIDMEQQRIDLRGEARADLGLFQAVKLRFGATDYEHVELEGSEVGTLFFNDYLETRLEAVQKRRGRSSGSIGLQYSERDLLALGDEAFLPENTTERWALFSFQQIDAGRFSFEVGTRFESQDVEVALSEAASSLDSRSDDALSASVGLVYRPSDSWSLGVSAARSVKQPNAEELFSDGLHAATQTFEIGNPALDQEIGHGLDVSLRKSEGKVTGELTLFRQDFDDFIYQAFSGDEREGAPVVVYRQADAQFVGAELQARIELFEGNGRHLHLQLLGDLVEADLEGGPLASGPLPRIPPLRLGAGLHFHSEGWSATAELRFVDEQNDVAGNETPTDGYTMVNASVGYRQIYGGQIVDFLLRGRNLSDEEARVHTSFLKDFAPLPGRDLSLSVRFWF